MADARLIVCAGPGGVGKTTTSAALGLRAALQGKRVIVLTIDPARRLADSMGLKALTNEPQRVETGDDEGELWAMMLDQQQTLDDLVARYAPDQGAVKRSRENNIYQLLSKSLHGMQEYMALDKLHDLYTSRKYDLVVLDTPPTKNALEFLETPGRARQFFDDRIIKWFLPNKQKKGFLSRIVNPNSVVITLLEKVFGESFVNELIEFFDTLQFLQEALKNRGELIDMILRDTATHFFVITGADQRRIDEAIYFHEKLADLNQDASAFVLNRVIPKLDVDIDAVSLSESKATMKEVGLPPEMWASLQAHYQSLKEISDDDHEMIDGLKAKLGASLVHTVEMMSEDIHDLQQLKKLGSVLAGAGA